MRRATDVVFAILSLLIMAPLLGMIAVFIKLDTPGPVLYIPQMVGQNGKVFFLFRFRTMTIGTTVFNDERRLTRVGGWVRNYSLDHLPMLINLLMGDLTLVGPRPMEVDVVDLKDPMWEQYFQIKPGLFNYAVHKLGKLWTPSRVSHPTINQELELDYRKERSGVLDWKLFVQFLKTYFQSRGNVKARGLPDPEAESKLNDP